MPDTVINIYTSGEPAVKAGTEDWDRTAVAGQLIKSDDERRYTLTVAYPANKADVGKARDGFRDFASESAVEDAAWSFLKDSPNIGLWHQDGTDGAGDVVESYIYRGPDWKVSAPDGSEQVIKSGDWLLGVQWPEQTYRDIKEGRIGGVSPQGTAVRGAPDPDALAYLRKQSNARH